MSKLNINENLFLEVQELNRLQSFLSTGQGSALDILNRNSFSAGIIKNLVKDNLFSNFKVEAGTNIGTIKIAQDSFAIDASGKLIYFQAKDNINLPNNNRWYWIKIAHQYTSIEKGLVSVDTSGNLTGIGTKFTEILRGNENFPVKVKFYNTENNFEEYEVFDVIDDTNAILVGTYVPETQLNFSVIGSFTEGYVPPIDNREIYKYDSCINLLTNLQLEVITNQAPPKVLGTEFYIARVKLDISNTLVIEDKRIEIFELQADNEIKTIDRTSNPLIGVDSVKWEMDTTAKTDNQVNISWGMKSNNWTIESSLRKLTISSGQGGKFKSTDDFTDGDFNDWRVYTADGQKYIILNSFRQGTQINLILDSLDPDNFITGQELTIVPNSEEICIKIASDPTDLVPYIEQIVTFPIRIASGAIVIPNPKFDIPYQIVVSYAYKSLNIYTDYKIIPDDNISGYYQEVSFVSSGALKPALGDRVKLTYQNGLITLTPNPNNFVKFAQKVDKGDIFGVQIITDLNAESTNNIIVGTTKNYIHIFNTSDVVMSKDVIFDLKTGSPTIEGNRFTIHFELKSVDLAGKTIKITQDFSGGNTKVLKELKQGDFYEMQNQDNGILFDLAFDGIDWIISQNYNLGKPYQVMMIDGDIASQFNTTNGMGKVKGLFGAAICDRRYSPETISGVFIPDLSDKFLIGESLTKPKGTEGGLADVTLTIDQIPAHSHDVVLNSMNFDNDGASGPDIGRDGSDQRTFPGAAQSKGGGQSHTNIPPYYSIIFAKQLY